MTDQHRATKLRAGRSDDPGALPPRAVPPSRSRRVPSSPGARRGKAAVGLAVLTGAAQTGAVLAFSAVFALSGTAAADGAPRLLTGLTAEAGPAGVRLAWTVDESRANRIAGFACVYRTPGHLKTGAPGSVACGSVPAPAGARALTVAGLPEYGDYLFELVALAGSGPAIPWPRRALQVRVTVTEALAGAAGPGRAVTGAGPLVEACRPADAASRRPWRRGEIVSAAHLTHFPGQGWGPAGDPAAPPEWPEPTPLPALVAAAGLDAGPVRQALAGGDMDREALARTLADRRFAGAAARAGLGTKALLRRGSAGGRVLRLHSSYPFGDDYAFGAAHAVPGWADAARPALWPALWNRADCPPAGRPNATHDVALALADDVGGGRRLAHAGYGWWAVAPVGMFPGRIVATQGGLSFGAPAVELPESGARWTGRLAGHLFWDRRRWAVAGAVSLELLAGGGAPRLAGRVENLVLAPIDAKSLEPVAGPDARLPALALGAGRRTQGAGPAGAWSGALALGCRARRRARHWRASRPPAPSGATGWPRSTAPAGRKRRAACGCGRRCRRARTRRATGRCRRCWLPASAPRGGWRREAAVANAGHGGGQAPPPVLPRPPGGRAVPARRGAGRGGSAGQQHGSSSPMVYGLGYRLTVSGGQLCAGPCAGLHDRRPRETPDQCRSEVQRRAERLEREDRHRGFHAERGNDGRDPDQPDVADCGRSHLHRAPGHGAVGEHDLLGSGGRKRRRGNIYVHRRR